MPTEMFEVPRSYGIKVRSAGTLWRPVLSRHIGVDQLRTPPDGIGPGQLGKVDGPVLESVHVWRRRNGNHGVESQMHGTAAGRARQAGQRMRQSFSRLEAQGKWSNHPLPKLY